MGAAGALKVTIDAYAARFSQITLLLDGLSKITWQELNFPISSQSTSWQLSVKSKSKDT